MKIPMLKITESFWDLEDQQWRKLDGVTYHFFLNPSTIIEIRPMEHFVEVKVNYAASLIERAGMFRMTHEDFDRQVTPFIDFINL